MSQKTFLLAYRDYEDFIKLLRRNPSLFPIVVIRHFHWIVVFNRTPARLFRNFTK